MIKDRTREFQKLAEKNGKFAVLDLSDSFTASNNFDYKYNGETGQLLNVEEAVAMDLQRFLIQMSEAMKHLNEMKSCLSRMREIHSKILISPGTHPDYTKELNEKVERFKQLSLVLNGITQMIDGDLKSAKKKESVIYRIKSNQRLCLNHILLDLLSTFNNEQTEYRDKCRFKMKSYLKIANLDMPEDEVDEAIENGKLFNTVGILMADRDKRALFEDVKQRHDDIVFLETSIRELHEIFQDMFMLVESQGEMLNNIERNVESALEHAIKAKENVIQAKESKNRNIKLKILLLICIMFLILILFLVGSTVFCFYLPFVCR